MYKIRFEQLRQGNLGELFTVLEEELLALGIDFYLIGAIARDIWLTALHNIEPGRITRDVDLAILLASEDQFKHLKQRLIETGRFTVSRGNVYTLIFDDGRPVDLLPFGAVSMEEAVRVEGEGLTSIRVDGFKEVYEAGIEEVAMDDQSYQVCTLPGIIILKLIAYDDRPEHRPKDIVDIRLILENYFEIADTEIYEQHTDLFDWPNFDVIKAAARVMGRQMQPIINRSVRLQERITTILDGQLNLGEESKVAEWFIRDTPWTLGYSLEIFEQLREGLRDKLF